MNPFFAYLIKSSLSLMLLYCLFRVSMRNDRNHTLTRFLLLGILGVSAIIPALNIQFFYEDIPLKSVETIREFVSAPVFSEPVLTETIQPVLEVSSLSINWGLLFYISVSSVLFLRLIFGVIQVMKIIKCAEKRRLQKIVLALVKDLIQPFSFLNKVVLSEKDYTENKQIIVAHEYAHIKQLHAIDLMVCELFTVLQFFNPFMWLLRRDIKLIHEYQADEAVLNKGIDAQKYQLLVLKKAVGERRFAMANQFTQKPILKRLTMMTKTNKSRWGRVKLLLFVPIIIVLLQAFARPEILVEKASSVVPFLAQQDSSEVWIDNWVNSKMSQVLSDKLNKAANNNKLKKVEVLNTISTGEEQYFIEGKPLNDKNVFILLQNRRGEKLIEGKYFKDEQIKSVFENFIKGKNSIKDVETDYELKNLPFVGDTKISKGIIFYRRDVETPKTSSESVLKTLGGAYLDVRKETALRKFNQEYFSLSKEKKEVINIMVPIRVSMAVPKTIKPPPPPPPPPPTVQINLKNNGDIFIGKTKYDSFSEFQDKLTAWDNGVRNSNKKNGSHYLNKARISIESAVAEDKVKQVEEALIRANFKNSNLLFIKDDVPGKLKPPPPPPPIYIKIGANGEFYTGKYHFTKESKYILWSESISKEAMQKYITKKSKSWEKVYGKYDPKSYFLANITVEEGVTESEIANLKEVLRNAKISNVNYSTDLKKKDGEGKNTPPPPPPPIFRLHLYENKIVFGKEEIGLNEVALTAENWLKRYGKKYMSNIQAHGDVSDERINELKSEMIKGGVKNQISIRRIK